MKAVITVTGADGVGIVAKVSALCAEYGANIVDISQSVLQGYFAMIMIVDLSGLKVPFTEFVDISKNYGDENDLQISAMHENIFSSMHHI